MVWLACASTKCSFDRMLSEPNTTSMLSSRSESRSSSSMLLEKVMAVSAVKPANRSSQPASSRPVSSARKTVSGFPTGANLALAKRSSGMIRPPLFDGLTDQRAARGSPSRLSSIRRINGLVIRVGSVEIPSRMSTDQRRWRQS
jgi:hypothetical protein